MANGQCIISRLQPYVLCQNSGHSRQACISETKDLMKDGREYFRKGTVLSEHQYLFLYKYQNRSQKNPSPAAKFNRPTKPTTCAEKNNQQEGTHCLVCKKSRASCPDLYSPGCSLDMYLSYIFAARSRSPSSV